MTTIPNEFTAWAGGNNPAPGKTVLVLFPDGDKVMGRSSLFTWCWNFDGKTGSDIIAYRVMEETAHDPDANISKGPGEP